MSGFLPAGTTLQLSDSSGNINFQGVLASNISNTPLLSGTFPSTSTGASLCHSHYTEATTNALKFLNSSGTGEGGHQFWNSTSTSAPVKYFDVNKDRALFYSVIRNPTNKVVLDLLQDKINIYNTNKQQIEINSNTLGARNTETSDNAHVQTDNVAVGNDINGVSGTLTATFVSIFDALNSHQSKLTSTDLTFDNVSLPSAVSTNTADIITNTADIITNTTDIATNTADIITNTTDINLLEIKQTNTIYQFASPAIYADGRPMLATPTSIINSYAINSWYFKNTTAGWKINWYIGPDNGMVVSDVLGLYLRFFNVSTVSNDNIIFLTVYTKLQPTNNYSSWFHSSMTYVIDQSITPVVNTNYTMFENCSGSCPNPSHYATTLVGMQQSTVQNPKGTYAPTDEILAFSIGSNSASPVNTVEFVLQKFGIMTSNGTQEFQFAPLI